MKQMTQLVNNNIKTQLGQLIKEEVDLGQQMKNCFLGAMKRRNGIVSKKGLAI